ncbi:fdxN element excision recombinase XisF [Aulosira sp. FACHB-615]|uniref:fdxN element excision recombinase XisF n=1 Tax=Aulosira sp. FACHB-615 TaxID=2692777 RepID=UPI0016870EDC|nr:fdxN element excision recombinase XisF [Aulosira sp. FACHB-615]MBD2492616.1 recombinase family protein [Aulosira sp. FACHB-615]
MKIAYCRVSSKEQANNSHALEQQVERLRLAGAEEVYIDVESGYKGRKRSQLEQVMKLVRSRQVSEVIVTRIDRLSRKGKQAFALFDDFLDAGVVLRALDEPFDLSTPSGKMAAGMLAVLAQHHSDQKSEAVKHGWQHLRNSKVAIHPPFGYCKINDEYKLDHAPFLCLLFNKEERSRSQIATEIISAFFEGRSLRGCLKIINEKYGIQTFAHHHKTGGLFTRGLFRFSPGGLRTWLLNPVLRGHTCYLRKKNKKTPENWNIHYNTHADQTILTELQLQEIEQILAHNRQVRGYGQKGQMYPLSGLVFCGGCRSSCYSCKGSRGKNQPGYNYYYQCKNWRVRSCDQKRVVAMQKIEDAVIAELVKIAGRIVDLALEPEVEIESPEIRELRQQLDGLSLLGNNPAIEKAKKDIENQIEGLKIQQNTHNNKSENNRDFLLWVFSDPSCWRETATVDQKISVYRSLVEKIIIKDGAIASIALKV